MLAESKAFLIMIQEVVGSDSIISELCTGKKAVSKRNYLRQTADMKIVTDF